MSANSTEPSLEADILGARIGYYQVAVSFLLWGIQISLAFQALYILWKRGLQRRSQQFLSAVVLIMLVSGSATVIIQLDFYTVQLYQGLRTVPEITRQVKLDTLVLIWLTRFNYCLSDCVVVWRAWALWPGNKCVRWILGISTAATLASTTTNVILMTVQQYLKYDIDLDNSGPIYPLNTLRALLYIPLIVTNALATALICYKAWLYRNDIRTFTTDTGRGRKRQGSSSSARVELVFALFIETGALYVVFFILNMMGAYGLFLGSNESLVFYGVWQVIMNGIAMIYPTLIIILVSKFMSQSDVIYSAIRRRETNLSFDGQEKPNNVIVPGALSTIRFDGPPSSMSTSSVTNEGIVDGVSDGERRENFPVRIV